MSGRLLQERAVLSGCSVMFVGDTIVNWLFVVQFCCEHSFWFENMWKNGIDLILFAHELWLDFAFLLCSRIRLKHIKRFFVVVLAENPPPTRPPTPPPANLESCADRCVSSLSLRKNPSPSTWTCEAFTLTHRIRLSTTQETRTETQKSVWCVLSNTLEVDFTASALLASSTNRK